MAQAQVLHQDSGGPMMRRLVLAYLRGEGMAAAQAGRGKRAADCFRQALALDEEDPDLWTLLGAVTPDPVVQAICARQVLRLDAGHRGRRTPPAVRAIPREDHPAPLAQLPLPIPAIPRPVEADGAAKPAAPPRPAQEAPSSLSDRLLYLPSPGLRPGGRSLALSGSSRAAQAIVLSRPMPAVRWRPSPFRRARLIGLALLTLVVVLNLVLAAAYVGRYEDALIPGVRIAGLDLGGLGQAEAARILYEQVAGVLNWPIVLQYGERTWNLRAEQVGLRYRIEEACEEAWAIGRRDSTLASWWDRLAPGGHDVLLPAEVRGGRLQALVEQVAAELDRPAISPTSVWLEDHWEILPGQDGRWVRQEELREGLVELLARLVHGERPPSGAPLVLSVPVYTQPAALPEAERVRLYGLIARASRPFALHCGGQTWDVGVAEVSRWLQLELGLAPHETAIRVDREALRAYLFQIAPQVVQPPVLPRMEVVQGHVVALQAGNDGRQLEMDDTVAGIEHALQQRLEGEQVTDVELATEVVRAGDEILLTEMELIELIGEGSSSFVGSPSNRITNIMVGGRELHGRLIAPGEVFSLNRALYPITGAKGYVSAQVIFGGSIVMGLGGGLCQVATTLYRAALYGGLEIVERHPHLWRIGWYEQDSPPGFDATIAMGGPDLRFRNNTGHYLLMQVETDLEQSRQVIRFYGVSPDWEVTVDEVAISQGGYSVSYRRTVTQGSAVLSQETITSQYSRH